MPSCEVAAPAVGQKWKNETHLIEIISVSDGMISFKSNVFPEQSIKTSRFVAWANAMGVKCEGGST